MQGLCEVGQKCWKTEYDKKKKKKNRPLLTLLILAKLEQAAQPVAVVGFIDQ